MEDALTRFTDNLTTLREKMGYSQGKFAKTVDMSPSYISRLEKGQHVPSLETLARLAEALGISISTLLGEREIEMDQALADPLAHVIDTIAPEVPHVIPLIKKVALRCDELCGKDLHLGAEAIALGFEILAASLGEVAYAEPATPQKRNLFEEDCQAMRRENAEARGCDVK